MSSISNVSIRSYKGQKFINMMQETFEQEKKDYQHEHYTRREGEKAEKHLYPIICVEGVKEEGASESTNTCGGDSGKWLKDFLL